MEDVEPSSAVASGGRLAPQDAAAAATPAGEVSVTGWLEHVYGPRLFTIVRDEPGERELLVFVPTGLLTPRSGSRLRVHGAFRRCEEAFDEVVDLATNRGERTRRRKSRWLRGDPASGFLSQRFAFSHRRAPAIASSISYLWVLSAPRLFLSAAIR